MFVKQGTPYDRGKCSYNMPVNKVVFQLTERLKKLFINKYYNSFSKIYIFAIALSMCCFADDVMIPFHNLVFVLISF